MRQFYINNIEVDEEAFLETFSVLLTRKIDNENEITTESPMRLMSKVLKAAAELDEGKEIIIDGVAFQVIKSDGLVS